MSYNHINLLEELDSASAIHQLHRDDIDTLMLEFAKRITSTLKIERTNAWLFNDNHDSIVSIGEYDTRNKSFVKNTIIHKSDCPSYFKAIAQNKIILIKNVLEHPYTNELNSSYSIPNNIISLMDIPLRISGEIIGVLCFEKTGDNERIFSEIEQTFAMSIAVVLASNLEARKRRIAQNFLEIALKEKELLIKEINHRVKNNLTILISLLRLAKTQTKNANVPDVIQDFEQRVMAMIKIHELLQQTENYTSVNISEYLQEITQEFKHSFDAVNLKSEISKIDFLINSKDALHLGLIVTEIFLNSVKHGQSQVNLDYLTAIKLIKKGPIILLTIKNSGKPFDFEKKSGKNTLGLSLIKDLAQGITLKAKYPTIKDSYYEFEF